MFEKHVGFHTKNNIGFQNSQCYSQIIVKFTFGLSVVHRNGLENLIIKSKLSVMRLVRAVDYEFYKEQFVSLLYFRFSLGYFPLLRMNKVLLKKLF